MRRRSRHRSPDRCYPALDDRVSARFLRLPSGLRVRLVETGPAEGVPVVLLPGWAVSAFTYRHQLPVLAAGGFRATAVDLKGHGFSDKPTGAREYTLESMQRHVAEVVEVVARRPAVIVGQSMAGRLALDLALSRPDAVAAMVLISPVGLGVVPFSALARLLTPRSVDIIAPYVARRIVVRLGLQLAYGDSGRVTDDAIEEYWAPAQFPDFARALRGLAHDFDWSEVSEARLAGLRTPTLVLRGSRDRLVRRPPAWLSTLPRTRVAVIDGAGHALNEECPELANAAIVDFLNGHTSGRSGVSSR